MNGSADFTAGVLLASVICSVLLLMVCLVLLAILLMRSRAPERRPAPAEPPAERPAPPAERPAQGNDETAGQARADEQVQTAEKARVSAEQAREAAEKEKEQALQQANANLQWYNAAVAETGRLVERLNAVADAEVRGYSDVVVPGLLHPQFAGTPLSDHIAGAEELLREAVHATRADVSGAARAGVRGMAEEVQMYLARLQMSINEALDLPPGTDPHRSLVEMDAHATWALHAVQRLRILAGSWPGVQRADCTFREIVESARGRIPAYDRVDYTYVPDVGERWVEGRVVEPITVALAELLANATSYTGDRVSVYVREVPKGFCVVIDDKGAGLNSFQLAEAERLLSRQTTLDAANLADERKLGFAIIGTLAHDYGFHVDVSAPSPSGGVQASCLVPHHLMSAAPGIAAPPRETAPPQPALHAAPAPVTTSHGLPKRERRHAVAPLSAQPTQQSITDTRAPEDVAADLGKLSELLSTGLATGRDNDAEGHSQP
ncbi:ATP-binding protein [Nonomuraea ceibae]|uniref:ATP-binding protein n=1 Tax=Nonomuraea ceibae TaxID=1935170 RepID=UPI001C5CCD2F|nr:hypothetical protein [Nonomuraea ceibae]